MADFKVNSATFAAIKQDIINFLSSQTEFTDYNFLGSRLNVLVEVLTYSVLYTEVYANAALFESFLSTAQIRNAIVQHAQEDGLEITNYLASRTIVEIETSTTGAMDRYKSFTGSLPSGVTYNFLNWDSVVFSGTTNFKSSVELVEGSIRYKTWKYNNTRLLIKDSNIDRSRIRVKVNGEEWTKVDNSVRITSTDKVFYIRETTDGFTEIYFGEGEIVLRPGQEDLNYYVGGLKPLVNQIINVEYLVCSGADANGCTGFVFSGSLTPDTTTVVAITEPTDEYYSGTYAGAFQESSARLKYLAPKKLAAQNRCVTAEDYEVTVSEQYGSFISAIKAWGDSNKPGYAFISIKPTGGLFLPRSLKEEIQRFLSDKNILTITALVTDPDYIFIEQNISVNYDLNTIKVSEGELSNQIIDSIDQYYNESVENFNKSFHVSKLTKYIDQSNDSILGSSCSIRLIKERTDWTKSDGTVSFDNAIVDSSFTTNILNGSAITSGPGVLGIGNLYWAGHIVGQINYNTGDFSYDLTPYLSVGATAPTAVYYVVPQKTDIYVQGGSLIVFENNLRPEYTSLTLEGIL